MPQGNVTPDNHIPTSNLSLISAPLTDLCSSHSCNLNLHTTMAESKAAKAAFKEGGKKGIDLSVGGHRTRVAPPARQDHA
jgi:hypothetical protein